MCLRVYTVLGACYSDIVGVRVIIFLALTPKRRKALMRSLSPSASVWMRSFALRKRSTTWYRNLQKRRKTRSSTRISVWMFSRAPSSGGRLPRYRATAHRALPHYRIPRPLTVALPRYRVPAVVLLRAPFRAFERASTALPRYRIPRSTTIPRTSPLVR